jgi:hypothetical protein
VSRPPTPGANNCTDSTATNGHHSVERTNSAKNHRKPGRMKYSFVPRLEVLEDRTLPSTLMVTNTNDKGPGSLRGTITNAKSGDTIVFAPSLEGHRTVQPTPVKHPVRESLPAVLAFRSSLSLSKNTSNPRLVRWFGGWEVNYLTTEPPSRPRAVKHDTHSAIHGVFDIRCVFRAA